MDDDEAYTMLLAAERLLAALADLGYPGDQARTWERLNGSVHLEVMAGKAMHPFEQRLMRVGLPFGPKACLVLMHINQQALLAQSPEIEVQDTLTSLVHRFLKLDTGGRTVKTVKNQLARLSPSSIRLGMVKYGRTLTVNSQIVSAFDIWFPKDERQRVFWPPQYACSWITGRA